MWVWIHLSSNASLINYLIKMLMLIQLALFLDLALHVIYFFNLLAEYVMCSHLLYQHCSEQDQFEDFPEDIQDL